MGRPFKALQLYEGAIRAAAENGYPQDQALANLLTSSFYRERDMNNIAAGFLEEACRASQPGEPLSWSGSSGKDMPHRALTGRRKVKAQRRRPQRPLSPPQGRSFAAIASPTAPELEYAAS